MASRFSDWAPRASRAAGGRPDQGCQRKHDIGLGQQRFHRRPVAGIASDRLESLIRTAFREFGATTREGVEHGYRVAFVEELANQDRSDIPGTAGNEDSLHHDELSDPLDGKTAGAQAIA